jgi:hypothetical protein
MLMHPTAFFTVTFRALLTMPAGARSFSLSAQLGRRLCLWSRIPVSRKHIRHCSRLQVQSRVPSVPFRMSHYTHNIKGGTTTDPRMEQQQRKHRKIGPLQNPVSRKRRPSTVRLESYSAASPSIWLIPPGAYGNDGDLHHLTRAKNISRSRCRR